jgi:hypothetical protein
MNLVSLVKQFLTPDVVTRISAALGLDRYTTQTAIGAAVPGLLAGLAGVARTSKRRPASSATSRTRSASPANRR